MDPWKPSTSRYGATAESSDPFSESFDAEDTLDNFEVIPRPDDIELDTVDEYEAYLQNEEPELIRSILELDKAEFQQIVEAERRLKGRKRRELALEEVVRKGNELKKVEAAAKGEALEVAERTLFDRKRERAKKHKDVCTRMDTMEGPLARLREYRNRQKKVMIVLRSDHGVNRVLTAQILAFDKHWNLVLRNVSETYRPARRLGKVQALQGQMPATVRYDQTTRSAWRYSVQDSKRHVLERQEHLLFVMGDSVVFVSEPTCPKMKLVQA